MSAINSSALAPSKSANARIVRPSFQTGKGEIGLNDEDVYSPLQLKVTRGSDLRSVTGRLRAWIIATNNSIPGASSAISSVK